MKYENFSAKKLQICDFFCNFVPDLGKISPKKGILYGQITRL